MITTEKKSHIEVVKEEFIRSGTVSRNWCLQRYISRLAAIVGDLKEQGWNISGEWVKTDYGKDYVYRFRPKATLF